MDTAHGQDPHIDRLYLHPDADEVRKRPLGDEYTYERMKRVLLTGWRRFADRYDRHDG